MIPQVVVLRQRYVVPLLLAGVVGRIPSAIAALAISLTLRDFGRSYSDIGLTLGVYACGLAIGGPLLGRLVDRRGQSTVLVASSLVAAVGFLGIDLSRNDQLGVLLATALAGLATPPLEPCLRALWPGLVGQEKLDAALSLDAAAQELIFIVGPLVVVGCVALAGARTALWLAAALGVLGAAAFATTRPARQWAPVVADRHWLGPLRNVGLLALFACLLCSGGSIGALNLVVVSYAERVSITGGAGLLLALNAAGALMGAMCYGLIRWRVDARLRLLMFAAGMAVAYWSLVSVPGPSVMPALMLVTGMFLAPLLAVAFSLVTRLAESAYVTEAFAWLVTMFTVGSAIGSPLAGSYIGGGVGGGAAVAATSATLAAVCAAVAQTAWQPSVLSLVLE